MEQRWLSKTGICTVLGITENTLKTYVKHKYIVKIGKHPNIRYLDPTPDYAEQLRLGQALHSKQNEDLFNLSSAALLTLREVAEIVGWRIAYAQQYMFHHKVPCIKIGSKFKLYRVETVRDLLWERSDRKGAVKQQSRFLLSELIKWFWDHYAAECEATPTDTQFAEDDLLQIKLTRMMKLPTGKRELALAAFMERMELAKQVVSTVKASASLRPSACLTKPPLSSAS